MSGLLNLQAGTVITGGLDISGGIVQGFGTIVGGVINNGTLDGLAGTLATLVVSAEPARAAECLTKFA